MKISIKWNFEVDDAPLHGNLVATGDEVADRNIEREAMERLERGDVWVWFMAMCEASITVDGETFVGRSSLGGCSYRDRADFMKDAGAELQGLAVEYLYKALQPDTKRMQAAAKAVHLIATQGVEFEVES